jgi:branched-chain amino acid transport system ATP-binding protein
MGYSSRNIRYAILGLDRHYLACRVAGEGISMLIAEQNVKFLELGDRAFTMEVGRVGFRGTPAEIAADDGLRRAYFGLGV